MRITAILFCLASLPLAAFAGWGLFTQEGRRNYDEMDGMIPFFAGCAAAACLVLSLVLILVDAWRIRRK